MIAAGPATHVRLDRKGVAWIDDTKVKVVEVILDHLAYGHSPEEIHLQHPHLSPKSTRLSLTTTTIRQTWTRNLINVSGARRQSERK
jgi:uncharacterized protein (DUF433 family)